MYKTLPTIVIGSGLIGSAAAAYLKAALPEEEVLLIGPLWKPRRVSRFIGRWDASM